MAVVEKDITPVLGPPHADDLTPLAISTKQDSVAEVEHTNSNRHGNASEKTWLKVPFQSVDVKFAVIASRLSIF